MDPSYSSPWQARRQDYDEEEWAVIAKGRDDGRKNKISALFVGKWAVEKVFTTRLFGLPPSDLYKTMESPPV